MSNRRPADPPPMDAIAALVDGRHSDPFSLLGPHADSNGNIAIRCFLPHARSVTVLARDTKKPICTLACLHDAGFFSGTTGQKSPFAYLLQVDWNETLVEIEDPYRFGNILGDLDLYLFGEGNHLHLYEKMGAHPTEMDGVTGTSFAVWAPSAARVSVVGDFNCWDGRRHPMRCRHNSGIWEIFLPGIMSGAAYKFEIRSEHGEILPLKADPFAFAMEHPPRTAACVHGLVPHDWQDEAWMARRGNASNREAPISIYEVHLGSWMRVPEEGNRFLTWREMAEKLVPYVKDMGFTHLEILPISEFPFDGSWGYQPLGLFSPTSRFGTPEDFAAFVDACHQAGLAIILDWVPGHFPTDSHGLAMFDGSHLYEHADPRKGFHQDWNTLIYNYGRHEVANFLLANAAFWCDRFHIDGLRVDAVASMLYLDYSRKPGEWVPNRFGGNENLEALAFIRKLNEQLYARFPGIATFAEESTAWSGVSKPTWLGGLGFGFKWNMGWMHDTLRYISKETIHRKYHHNDLGFGLLYAFHENFILPLSHDEVVHGKGSLLSKMPGDRWQKFANLRAYFGFMFGHPGKKLLFMGGEFAQEREWNHDNSLDWHLLDDPAHAGMKALVRDLNHLYQSRPALYQRDCEGSGFEWLEINDSDNSTIAFLRRNAESNETVIAICNFTPVPRHNYRIRVPEAGFWQEILNTDAGCYGGSNMGNVGGVHSDPVPWGGGNHSINLTLPPLSTIFLERKAE
ncbi:MAG: 1,4-alpha-glucan branching enzyme [Alphaproteobacteria bacterium GWF2_58_20]|nr:MAG: 1,4-alpha-glucan branching enzyme [Alphaproteobacteria bacterium GWF2_58_20]